MNKPIAPEKVKPVGVKKTATIANDVERAAFELHMLGYTQLDSGFSESELKEFSDRLDAAMEIQRKECGGAEYMKTTGESHFIRALIVYDETFFKVCRHPKILELAEMIMGAPVYLNQQNAVLNPPGDVDYETVYHRDFPHQHFTSSHALALTVLLCVDDFMVENGATMVLPGSHKIEPFPDESVWRNREVPMTGKKGTFLIMDSMLFHRTGKNKTEDFRRAVVQVYSIPLIKQVISFPHMFGDKYKDDPELATFLGYPYETANNVMDFRRARGMVKEGL